MADAGSWLHFTNCVLDYDPLWPRVGPLIESAVSSEKMFNTDYKASFRLFVIAGE
jgi:hypothetical protein